MNAPVDINTHPADQRYKGLQCDIEPMAKGGEYDLLKKYLLTTHGKTHTMYTLDVLDIYKISK